MAEDNKNPEVELDTDGVKEESIEIADTAKDEKPEFQRKEDVDLGYNEIKQSEDEDKRTYDKKKDHGNDITYENEREVKLDQKEAEDDKDSLEGYSDKVQKRIKKLTFQIREAERREKAAMDYEKV